jgi:hypothetical protein
MCAQSKPYSEMIELMRQLKAKYGLKIIVLSNEARELNDYRIHKFKLDEFVDAFVSSCLVRLHKPDAAIFRLALDIAMTPARQIVYIENTPMFVQIADGLGFAACCIPTTNPPAKTRCARIESRLGIAHETRGRAHILTINGGSSSIKFALYAAVKPLKRGLCGTVDRIGLSGTNLKFHEADGKPEASSNLKPPITNQRRMH